MLLVTRCFPAWGWQNEVRRLHEQVQGFEEGERLAAAYRRDTPPVVTRNTPSGSSIQGSGSSDNEEDSIENLPKAEGCEEGDNESLALATTVASTVVVTDLAAKPEGEQGEEEDVGEEEGEEVAVEEEDEEEKEEEEEEKVEVEGEEEVEEEEEEEVDTGEEEEVEEQEQEEGGEEEEEEEGGNRWVETQAQRFPSTNPKRTASVDFELNEAQELGSSQAAGTNARAGRTDTFAADSGSAIGTLESNPGAGDSDGVVDIHSQKGEGERIHRAPQEEEEEEDEEKEEEEEQGRSSGGEGQLKMAADRGEMGAVATIGLAINQASDRTPSSHINQCTRDAAAGGETAKTNGRPSSPTSPSHRRQLASDFDSGGLGTGYDTQAVGSSGVSGGDAAGDDYDLDAGGRPPPLSIISEHEDAERGSDGTPVVQYRTTHRNSSSQTRRGSGFSGGGHPTGVGLGGGGGVGDKRGRDHDAYSRWNTTSAASARERQLELLKGGGFFVMHGRFGNSQMRFVWMSHDLGTILWR